MYQYRVLVRVPNNVSQYVMIRADGDNACKSIAEGMFGRGSVLSYHRT